MALVILLTLVGCKPQTEFKDDDISRAQTESKDDDISRDSNQFYTNLVNDADLIVKGKVLSEEKKVSKTIGSEAKDEKSVGITIPFITYNIEIIEGLKNTENHKNFSLALANIVISGINIAKVDVGKEYLFLLRYDREKKDYLILNYENGVYEWDNDLNRMISLTDHNIIDYDLLKSTIKKLNIK